MAPSNTKSQSSVETFSWNGSEETGQIWVRSNHDDLQFEAFRGRGDGVPTIFCLAYYPEKERVRKKRLRLTFHWSVPFDGSRPCSAQIWMPDGNKRSRTPPDPSADLKWNSFTRHHPVEEDGDVYMIEISESDQVQVRFVFGMGGVEKPGIRQDRSLSNASEARQAFCSYMPFLYSPWLDYLRDLEKIRTDAPQPRSSSSDSGEHSSAFSVQIVTSETSCPSDLASKDDQASMTSFIPRPTPGGDGDVLYVSGTAKRMVKGDFAKRLAALVGMPSSASPEKVAKDEVGSEDSHSNCSVKSENSPGLDDTVVSYPESKRLEVEFAALRIREAIEGVQKLSDRVFQGGQYFKLDCDEEDEHLAQVRSFGDEITGGLADIVNILSGGRIYIGSRMAGLDDECSIGHPQADDLLVAEVWIPERVDLLRRQAGEAGECHDFNRRKRLIEEVHQLERELCERRSAYRLSNLTKEALKRKLGEELQAPQMKRSKLA